jgi:hypothetical protein
MIEGPKFEVGKPFRDITALEVLRSGESEAHEKLLQSALGFERIATTIDARFAAIEARLKALEERNEPQARNEPDEGIPSLERDDPAV